MGVIPKDAIAAGSAISGTGSEKETCEMEEPTKRALERETDYRIAMKIGEALCQKGLVTKSELRRIERKLRRKFSPVWPEIN